MEKILFSLDRMTRVFCVVVNFYLCAILLSTKGDAIYANSKFCDNFLIDIIVNVIVVPNNNRRYHYKED